MSFANCEVILLLGKGVEADGSLPLRVQQEINNAITLCYERSIPVLLFSGKYSGLHINPGHTTEAVAMKQYAIEQNTKHQLTFFTEEESEDTISNIILSKVIIDRHGWRNILVMSSADHLQRVEYICAKVFGSNYQLSYHGLQQATTVRQYWHVRRYELMSWLFARRLLRYTWPDDNSKMVHWLYSHHFLYNGSRLKKILQSKFSRPVHR